MRSRHKAYVKKLVLIRNTCQSLPDGTTIVDMEAGTPQMEAIDFDYQFTVQLLTARGLAHTYKHRLWDILWQPHGHL